VGSLGEYPVCHCHLSLLWPPNRVRHYILQLRFLSSFFLSSFFLAYSQRSEIGSLPYLHTWCGLSANLECKSEMCCTWLAENTRRKSYSKNRHLQTIAPIFWAISSQLRHMSTIRKKVVKHQYVLHSPHVLTIWWTSVARGSLQMHDAKITQKIAIAQICRAISSQLSHVSSRQSEKMLNSSISSTCACAQNMVNFGPLTAEIYWPVWGTAANFNWYHLLYSLLHRCKPNFARCLAVSWASTLCIYFWGLLPPKRILPGAKFTLHSPILAALLHGTQAVGVSQTLRRGTRNGTGCLPYFHTWCGLSANLECRSEVCWPWLAANTAITQKIVICSPSHKFVALYLCN